MNGIGKIYRCGSARKVLNISGRSKAVYLFSKEIKVSLDKAHELLVVIGIPLPLKDLTEPGELFLLLLHDRTGYVLLVLPVCSDTILSRSVHLVGSYLYLKWLSLRSDQCGVKGLVHVGLRHGYVVLESSRNRLVHLMNDTQC